MKTGKTLRLSTVLRSDDYQKENAAVSWTSSNNKIATVNGWGWVDIEKKGTVEITATTADGTSKTIKLKAVDYFKVNKISIDGKKTMKPKSTQKLKVTIAPENADNQELTWKSSNKKIATVNKKGKVKAKKKGTVKITAKATDGSKKKAVFKIKIK